MELRINRARPVLFNTDSLDTGLESIHLPYLTVLMFSHLLLPLLLFSECFLVGLASIRLIVFGLLPLVSFQPLQVSTRTNKVLGMQESNLQKILIFPHSPLKTAYIPPVQTNNRL